MYIMFTFVLFATFSSVKYVFLVCLTESKLKKQINCYPVII